MFDLLETVLVFTSPMEVTMRGRTRFSIFNTVLLVAELCGHNSNYSVVAAVMLIVVVVVTVMVLMLVFVVVNGLSK